jgi:hypothetical protein
MSYPGHSTPITQLLVEHPDDEGHHNEKAAKNSQEAEQVGHLSSGDKKVSELGCHGNQLNLEGFCSTNRGELG